MSQDLTPEALQGYEAAPGTECPFYATSPSSMAWLVGALFRDTGRPQPRNVRPGRGYLMHANDMLFDCKAPANITRMR